VTKSAWTQSQTGNAGIELELSCEDGQINYTIWMTEKSRDRAKRELEALGVSEHDLQDFDFVSNRLLTSLKRQQVTFKIQEEEYKGKTKLKVGGISRVINEAELSRSMCEFFNGSVPAVITDADIPF